MGSANRFLAPKLTTLDSSYLLEIAASRATYMDGSMDQDALWVNVLHATLSRRAAKASALRNLTCAKHSNSKRRGP